jgi:uncharacterized membrane protein YdbT with pleckstrin-like domain
MLGSGIAKYLQITLLIFSLFLISILYLVGADLYFWMFFIAGLFIVNLIYYSFSDVKFNNERFVIEKMFFKKEIPSIDFIKVDRLPLSFGVFSIKFADNRYYYSSDFKSIFKNSSEITNEIKNQLNANLQQTTAT